MCCRSALRSMLRDAPCEMANEATNGCAALTAVELVMAAGVTEEVLHDVYSVGFV